MAVIRQWTVAGLALCSIVSAACAGESVVYQIDGWKMTITPGRSGSSLSKPGRLPQTSAAPINRPSNESVTPPRRFPVIPISLQQESPEAAKKDEAAVPSLKQGVDSVPAPVTSTVLPPLPPLERPTEVVCAEPIITPRSPDQAPFPLPPPPAQTAMYRDIYFSIPFNRAEYNAYPSYRHDATMEFLFNQMRPTVIQRGSTHNYNYDMGYGMGYGYGYGWPYTPYYPYTYGLRIHSSR
jgi:hypothetical protein